MVIVLLNVSSPLLPTVLRWIALLAVLLVAGGYVLLTVGEFTQPHSCLPSTISEWTGIALLTATMGMVLAWRWELPGAVMPLAALVSFTALFEWGSTELFCIRHAGHPGFRLVWFLRWRIGRSEPKKLSCRERDRTKETQIDIC